MSYMLRDDEGTDTNLTSTLEVLTKRTRALCLVSLQVRYSKLKKADVPYVAKTSTFHDLTFSVVASKSNVYRLA